MRRRRCSVMPVAAIVAWAGAVAGAAPPHPGFSVSVNGGVVTVVDVYEDTPAAVLDIRPGDVVAKVNHQPATPDALRRSLAVKRVGSTMMLTFLRDGEPRDLAVPLIDAQKPANWAAAAAATERQVQREFRAAMDEFVAKHGPVRILGARIEEEQGRRRVAVRIANASEHFLESCDLDVLFVDAAGRAVSIPGHDNPLRIRGTREVPPANPAGTRGIVTLAGDLTAPTAGAAAANVVVVRARLADGREGAPAEPQPFSLPLAP